MGERRRARVIETLGVNRIMSRSVSQRVDHLKRFYDILGSLEHRIGGPRRLMDCSGRMDWSCRGVYFSGKRARLEAIAEAAPASFGSAPMRSNRVPGCG